MKDFTRVTTDRAKEMGLEDCISFDTNPTEPEFKKQLAYNNSAEVLSNWRKMSQQLLDMSGNADVILPKIKWGMLVVKDKLLKEYGIEIGSDFCMPVICVKDPDFSIKRWDDEPYSITGLAAGFVIQLLMNEGMLQMTNDKNSIAHVRLMNMVIKAVADVMEYPVHYVLD